MTRLGMVIDLDACQGCRACMEACKVENNTGEDMFWMYVFRMEEGTYPHVKTSFLPRPCQHCDNAPCVKVCPVGSRFKREDGLVLTDFDRCIGCRYCEVACPYGVNSFNWGKPAKNQYQDWNVPAVTAVTGGVVPPYQNPDHRRLWGPEQRLTAGGGHYKGVVEKCTFCVHRVEQGLTTACAQVCPTEAILFGDLDDPDSAPSKKLREKSPWHLLEEVGTHPRVHYVGGKPPDRNVRTIDPVGRVT